MDPVLTPVNHDPFAVPKDGETVPYDVPKANITDYPWVREQGANLAEMVAEPAMQAGRLLTQGTSDPTASEDLMGTAEGLLPVGKLAAPLLSVFAGVAAKNADREALSLAQQMLSKGHTADEIWKSTGWFQGADTKWRFEIPDNESFEAAGRNTVGTRVHHPELFKAYPDLENVGVREYSKSGAYYQPAGVVVPEHIGMGSGSAHIEMLHELQHAIQEREGFAIGGDPKRLESYARGALEKSGQPVTDSEISKLAYEAYQRLAGETEARNVEFRAAYPDWYKLGKNKLPTRTEDRPRSKQTVIGVKLTPVEHDPWEGVGKD